MTPSVQIKVSQSLCLECVREAPLTPFTTWTMTKRVSSFSMALRALLYDMTPSRGCGCSPSLTSRTYVPQRRLNIQVWLLLAIVLLANEWFLGVANVRIWGWQMSDILGWQVSAWQMSHNLNHKKWPLRLQIFFTMSDEDCFGPPGLWLRSPIRAKQGNIEPLGLFYSFEWIHGA